MNDFTLSERSTLYHLKQGQVTFSNIVKVDFDVHPASLLCDLIEGVALTVVVDLGEGKNLICGGVDATVELPGKKINSHDAEDEPKNEAHQHHIEDGGNCSNEGVYHHLSEREPCFKFEMSARDDLYFWRIKSGK